MESSMNASEDALLHFVDSAPIGIIIHRDERIVYANAAAIGIIKAENNTVVPGRLIYDFVHPDYHVICQQRISNPVPGTSLPQIQMKFICANGEEIHVEVSSRHITFEGSVSTMVIFSDVTERKLQEDMLYQSQQRYKSLFDNNLDAIYQFDLNGRFIDVNHSLEETLGYTLSELKDMHFLQVVSVEDAERTQWAFEEVKRGSTISMELNAFCKNGKQLKLNIVSLPIQVNGEITGTFGIAKDVTSLNYSRELLANQKRILEMTAQGCSLEDTLGALIDVVEYHAPSAMCNVCLIREDGLTLYHYAGNQRLKGYNDDLSEIRIGPNASACGRAAFYNTIEIVENIESNNPLYDAYRHIALKNGLRTCVASPIVSTAGHVVGTMALYYENAKQPSDDEVELVGIFSRIAGIAIERQKFHEEIAHLAYHDPLTGLPNRTMFVDEFTKALEAAKRDEYHLAVMFLDLDRFKSFNDSLGHHFGDQLLKIVATRVKNCLHAGHILSRMGGDEFTILVPCIESRDSVRLLAERIIRSLDEPVSLDGQEFRLSTGIGIAVFPDDGDSLEVLMRNADLAMYAAKENGRNTIRNYTETMRDKFYERLTIDHALQQALKRQEFILHYQPRVEISTGFVTSIEALIRWNRPGTGMVSPEAFIPAAEELGHIVPMGKWVFYEVCRQIESWTTSGQIPWRIAVNVSAKQLNEPDFMDMLKQIIHETKVDPCWLEIEVTESGLIENVDHILSILSELKALGIKVSIDDFGVGYSSLHRLRSMQVDALKIDRSFIRDMFKDNGVITRTIIALAHNLQLNVVAEGVETEEQFNLLKEYGCHEVQGYFITPPLDMGELEKRYGREKIRQIGRRQNLI